LYHNLEDFTRKWEVSGVLSDCEELVGVTWRVSDCEELSGGYSQGIMRK